jgi:hypothetical protein
MPVLAVPVPALTKHKTVARPARPVSAQPVLPVPRGGAMLLYIHLTTVLSALVLVPALSVATVPTAAAIRRPFVIALSVTC